MLLPAMLMLQPMTAGAGTSYVVTNKSLSAQDAWSSAAQYFVQEGAVRAAGLNAHTVYLFKDTRAFVIDNDSKVVQVVKSATVVQARKQIDDRVTDVKDAAAKLPPEKRAVMDKMAADMQALNDRQRVAVPRAYHPTDRSEAVDGHTCRIWEAEEWQAKRFEICIAPKPAITGSAEILNGMRMLSSYWGGSIFALGVKLGNAGWWTQIAALDGLPILIREFKNGRAVSETTLTSIRSGVQAAAMFDLPKEYARTEVAFIP
jgi:hypothetical protein